MSKKIRTLTALVVLIMVPFMIYGLLQINSLREDEKMANDIYRKQMETVLFSLNQYANDKMGRWVSRLDNDKKTIYENAEELIESNDAIQMLIIRNLSYKTDSIFTGKYITESKEAEGYVDQWYTDQDSLLMRLSEYMNAGYQKIQPAIDWQNIGGLRSMQSGMTFMLYDQDSVLHNALFVLETNIWVEQMLGVKMQEIAQKNLRLAVLQGVNSEDIPLEIFSTESLDYTQSYAQNELWILPDISIGVQPTGKSYAEIIKERNKTNRYVLISSLIIMLIGAYVIIRNIRKTVKIAQLKSDFVSNVSHEIRTPLSLIKMYAETLMLGRVPSEEKKEHYYRVINHESSRLTYLVNNILDLSKIEANKKVYRPEMCNMNDLVKKTVENYQYTFQENGVAFRMDLFSERIDISIDIQSLEEAISNLIENAIKYGGNKKRIEIRTFVKQNMSHCEVRDFGVGISKNDQRMIFDKFFRSENALTQKTKGTGLGLSLVKHVIQSHGGEIKVDTTLGKGSTFTLILPIIQKKYE